MNTSQSERRMLKLKLSVDQSLRYCSKLEYNKIKKGIDNGFRKKLHKIKNKEKDKIIRNQLILELKKEQLSLKIEENVRMSKLRDHLVELKLQLS